MMHDYDWLIAIYIQRSSQTNESSTKQNIPTRAAYNSLISEVARPQTHIRALSLILISH